MIVNIEEMRADMQWESRKFLVSFVLAIAASAGAGVALGNYFTKHQEPPAPIVSQPPAQIVFQPGSIIVQQAPAPAPTK